MNVRNAPIEQMKNLGYHEGYKYPHDYPGHYTEQQYLPDEVLGTQYYVPDENVPKVTNKLNNDYNKQLQES